MKITKLTVELDCGETIDFELCKDEAPHYSRFSTEMKNPDLVPQSLLQRAEVVAQFVLGSQF